MHLGLPETALH